VGRLTRQGSFASGLHKLGANETTYRIAKIDAVGIEQVLWREDRLAGRGARQIEQLLA
jgi:hypothetical protein